MNRRALRWAGLLCAGLAAAGVGWYVTLPDGGEFADRRPERTAMMRQREAKGIRSRSIVWTPLPQISPALRHAVVVAEDANFYRHQGIDWEALRIALKRNWKERRLYRGGSTITQQLAKNLYLKPEKILWRKITEALIASRMERRLSKSRILELYLNVVEWGRGVYGAEAAARHHFGVSTADLTIAEAAWLAAVLPAPLRYESEPDKALKRAAAIQRLVERRLPAQPSTTEPVEPPPPLEELPAPLEESDPLLPDETVPPSEPLPLEETAPESPAESSVPPDDQMAPATDPVR